MIKRFIAVFLLFGAFFVYSAEAQSEKKISRAKALSIVDSCLARTVTCDEGDIYMVISRYWRGDRSLLNPLLDTRRVADGALGELLTEFYSEVIQKRPRTFLNNLLNRPKVEQENLLLHATLMDEKALKRVRRNLRQIANSRGRLSGLALSWLEKTSSQSEIVQSSPKK